MLRCDYSAQVQVNDVVPLQVYYAVLLQVFRVKYALLTKIVITFQSCNALSIKSLQQSKNIFKIRVAMRQSQSFSIYEGQARACALIHPLLQ